MSGDSLTQVAGAGDRSRVVHSRSDVVLGDVVGASLRDELLEAVTFRSARGAVLDHLRDLVRGARVLDAAVVARSSAVVALHETGVDDSIVGGGSAHTTVALLHHDGENETRVDASRLADRLDAVGHVAHLLLRGVGNAPLVAGAGHDILVGLEPVQVY